MEGGELRDGPGLGWGFIDLAYVSSGCLGWLSSVFHTLTVYASSGRLISVRLDGDQRPRDELGSSSGLCPQGADLDEPESLILAQSERWRHA